MSGWRAELERERHTVPSPAPDSSSGPTRQYELYRRRKALVEPCDDAPDIHRQPSVEVSDDRLDGLPLRTSYKHDITSGRGSLGGFPGRTPATTRSE